MASGDQVVTFQGHHSYIVSIARLCKENGLFTDVTILCDDGKLSAHRIVLAAVSPFLCSVLEGEVGGGQTTIVVPEVRREIVHQLLEFLYTGVMKLSQSATWELQQLVLLLQIDPQNVGVDTISVGLESAKVDRLAETACQTLGIKIARRVDIPTKVSPKQSPQTPKLSPTIKLSPKTKGTSPKVHQSPLASNGIRDPPESPSSPASYSPIRVHTPGSAIKVATPGSRNPHARGRGQVSGRGRGERGVAPAGRGLNTLKISVGGSRQRTTSSRSSTESDTQESGDSKVNTVVSVLRQEHNSNVIKIVTNRKRRSSAEAPKYSELDDDIREGPKRGRGVKARGRSSRRGRGGSGRAQKGLHDMENTTTWVCAICGQYDPILPGSISRDGDTTEWIGCDCNRWFHKFCTRLKQVDDSFSCRNVHKSCLPS
jgi:hypothetical protein